MRISALVLFGSVFISAFSAAGSACAGDATILGTGIGAAVGGFLGSEMAGRGPGQFLATGLGAAVGGTIGNSIGRDIDEDSAYRYRHGGRHYVTDESPSVVYYHAYTPNYVAPPAPPPTYVDQNEGTYCRPYSQQIVIDGEEQESYGTACLQPDGTWRIVN